MKYWWRKLLKEKRPWRNDPLEKELHVLLQYLKTEFFNEELSETYKERLKWFLKASRKEQIQRIPGLYLLAEHTYLKSDRGVLSGSIQLRQALMRKFPWITSLEHFHIVMLEESEQEKQLVLFLLEYIRQKVVDVFGSDKSAIIYDYKDNIIKLHLACLRQQLSREAFQEEVKREVKHLYDAFSDAAGKVKVSRWFQESYEILVDNYKFLESFSFLVGLLPEFLLTEQQLSLLSRSEIQQALVEKTRKLEKINKRLTSEIAKKNEAEQELIKQKERAEQATRVKADFLSTMSHEIRTPMNALYGTIELLLSENPRKDQLESLMLMKYSSENLLVILNDILDFSKLEEGHVEFDYKKFSLTELCRRVISVYKPQAEEKGLSLKTSMDEVHDTLQGDPTRLSQILNNLVSNAIKFTTEGSVSLNIALVEDAPNYVVLNFEVADTGKGIPQMDQERIFDRFTQLKDEDEHTTYTGTGLGLSISRKLLTLQDSDLSVDSTPGKGSSFLFEIKIDKGEEADSELITKPSKKKDLGGRKILLVEDNKVNQLVALKFLSKWNCHVEIATDGEEGLKKVKEKDYDIVLMDLQMPGMNGFEASEAIRALPEDKYKVLPIIALTADVFPEIKEKVEASGMNDFVAKPFNPDRLYFYIASNLTYSGPDN